MAKLRQEKKRMGCVRLCHDKNCDSVSPISTTMFNELLSFAAKIRLNDNDSFIKTL